MTNTPEGSAMSEPVAYKIVPINMVTTSENERDKWIKAGHEVEALYPASVVEALKAENEALRKQVAELEATLEDIADGKPRLMQSDFGHEFFCYQYNPTEKARKALFASKLSAASKNGDSK